jgi:hypothetical protein
MRFPLSLDRIMISKSKVQFWWRLQPAFGAGQDSSCRSPAVTTIVADIRAQFQLKSGFKDLFWKPSNVRS